MTPKPWLCCIVLNGLFERLKKVILNHTKENNVVYQIIAVDDGSLDNSYNITLNILKEDKNISSRLIKLSRNFGSYNTFLAGMNHCDGDCCVYLHADLQDPPELIPQLYENYVKGFKLVIANRESREDGTIFSTFYHWMIKVFGINNIPSGGFDLILFDKEIQNEVLKISEKNTNIVYLISWLGYPYVSIPYVRQKREHGTSQWFFWKKVRLLVDSVFSFTMLPAYWIRLTFVFMLVADFIFVIYEVCVRSIHPFNMMIMFFLTLILANILIISEYLLRIHDSVRNRPSFVVDKVLKFEN